MTNIYTSTPFPRRGKYPQVTNVFSSMPVVGTRLMLLRENSKALVLTKLWALASISFRSRTLRRRPKQTTASRLGLPVTACSVSAQQILWPSFPAWRTFALEVRTRLFIARFSSGTDRVTSLLALVWGVRGRRPTLKLTWITFKHSARTAQ